MSATRSALGSRIKSGGARGSAFLNEWKALVEAHGVLVFQARGVSFREARGFSIA